jgi:hypothetical protein
LIEGSQTKEAQVPYCTKCGGDIGPENGKCLVCGKPQHDAVKPASGNPSVTEFQTFIPSRSKRLAAGLIDLLLGVVLPMLLMWYIWRGVSFKGTRISWIFLGRFVLPFLPGAYYMLRDSLGGKSFGKMFMGISVVSLARLRPASTGDSLLRNSVFLVGLIPFAGVAAILILNATMALYRFCPAKHSDWATVSPIRW